MINSFFSKETFEAAVDFFSEEFWEKIIEMLRTEIIRKEKKGFIFNIYLTNLQRHFLWQRFQICIYSILQVPNITLKVPYFLNHQE